MILKKFEEHIKESGLSWQEAQHLRCSFARYAVKLYSTSDYEKSFTDARTLRSAKKFLSRVKFTEYFASSIWRSVWLLHTDSFCDPVASAEEYRVLSDDLFFVLDALEDADFERLDVLASSMWCRHPDAKAISKAVLSIRPRLHNFVRGNLEIVVRYDSSMSLDDLTNTCLERGLYAAYRHNGSIDDIVHLRNIAYLSAERRAKSLRMFYLTKSRARIVSESVPTDISMLRWKRDSTLEATADVSDFKKNSPEKITRTVPLWTFMSTTISSDSSRQNHNGEEDIDFFNTFVSDPNVEDSTSSAADLRRALNDLPETYKVVCQILLGDMPRKFHDWCEEKHLGPPESLQDRRLLSEGCSFAGISTSDFRSTVLEHLKQRTSSVESVKQNRRKTNEDVKCQSKQINQMEQR